MNTSSKTDDCSGKESNGPSEAARRKRAKAEAKEEKKRKKQERNRKKRRAYRERRRDKATYGVRNLGNEGFRKSDERKEKEEKKEKKSKKSTDKQQRAGTLSWDPPRTDAEWESRIQKSLASQDFETMKRLFQLSFSWTLLLSSQLRESRQRVLTKRFRLLSSRFHPDKHKAEDCDLFKVAFQALNEAFQDLDRA